MTNTTLERVTNSLNLHNFSIEIPGIPSEVLMLVESTNYPVETMRVITLYTKGEPVRYPANPENTGSWKFSIPESDDGSIRSYFENLKKRVWDQKTGKLQVRTFETVVITSYDLDRSVNDIGNPIFKVALHGAWLKGRNSVELNTTDPSKVWLHDFEFVYQWLEDL